MTITLHGLLAADTARVRAIAEHFFELAATLDAAVEDLGAGTRDLPHHWSSGPGSQAAQERVAELRIRVGNGHHDCMAIAYTVREFADGLEQSRGRLHDLVHEAESRGMRIDLASGQITAPVTTEADLGLAQGGVDAYVGQIAEILAQADAADRKALDALDQHVLSGSRLPNAVPPPPDEYSIQLVGAYPPEHQAEWWRNQHPLLQEQMIAEHPEIVGALPGMPSRDRDTANRLLLNRAKEAAVAERDRMAARQDTAAGEVLRQLDERLTGIAELEQRLAEPGTHLLSYQPGAERNASVQAVA